MQNLIMPLPPPNTDHLSPELCFCGKKTVESHEFWFCSTKCARLDSLRLLGDPKCHYRDVERRAYLRAGISELYPGRMRSADQLLHGPSQQRRFGNSPPQLPPPTKPSQRNVEFTPRDAQDRTMAGFPTLSQVAGNVLTGREAGEQPAASRQDRWEGFPNARTRPARRPQDQERTFEQISLDAIPSPEHVPARSLRHVPTNDNLKSNIKKSVAALLNPGRSRKGKDVEKSERVFGHHVNTIVPPMRKESLPSHRQKNPPPGNLVQSSKALRRSASFAGWDKTPHNGPFNGHEMVMRIVQEMRADVSGSFDPRSLFDVEEPC